MTQKRSKILDSDKPQELIDTRMDELDEEIDTLNKERAELIVNYGVFLKNMTSVDIDCLPLTLKKWRTKFLEEHVQEWVDLRELFG